MLHAIAIDDEPLALEVLTNHARELDFIKLERTFTNAAQGLEYLHKNKTHLLFLDINMPDRNGLDIAAQLPPNLQLVFTTAYAAHALNGFELNATDYLLKPISFTRFTQACNKAKQQLGNNIEKEELFIKESGAWHKIVVTGILYVESQGNYLKIVTADRSYLVRQTLYEFEQQLPASFARTHKSFMVNTRNIAQVGQDQVIVGTTAIPVSANYKKEFFNKLGLNS